MSRSIAAYPFPDDDGRKLSSLVSRLPDQTRFDVTWRPTDVWLLTVTLRFPRARSFQIIVQDRLRRTVQVLLWGLPRLRVGWERIEAVEFGSGASRIAFEALL